MTKREETGGAAPKSANVRTQAAKRAVGRPRSKKPTGRVSFDRSVSNAEAGRIRKAREALARQPQGQNGWDDCSVPLVDRIVLFCESLVITKGLLQGERLKLLEHQRDFITMIWGANPRPKLAISSMPRGQGKSTFLAALATAALLGPLSERRGEIVSVAVTKDQAAIIHAEIAAFITEIPQFSARCAISHHRKTIEVLCGRAALFTAHWQPMRLRRWGWHRRSGFATNSDRVPTGGCLMPCVRAQVSERTRSA